MSDSPDHQDALFGSEPDAGYMDEATELRAQSAAAALAGRLRAEAVELFGCQPDAGDPLCDVVVQDDAGRLAEQAAAYRVDPQVRSVHDESATWGWPWHSMARWNPLAGDMEVGYFDTAGGWSQQAAWRIVNDTGEPWPDAAAAELSARDTLKEMIVAMGVALVVDSYEFDDLIERWISLGLDRKELADAIEAKCYDVGTNIEEFVCERVEVSFAPASEAVMYDCGFEKARSWWRDSGLGPREAFDHLTEPCFEAIPVRSLEL